MPAQDKPSPGRHLTGTVENHPTATANIIEIRIRDKVVGRVQTVSNRESFGTEPLYEIGSMLPAEIVPTRWQGSITVDKYVLRKASIEALPLAYSESILKTLLFDVVIVDRTTGKTIEKFQGCVQSDAGRTYAAQRPVNQNATFAYMNHVEGNQ